jgi:hypothetical protein
MPTIYAGSVRIRLLKSVALPKGANELVFEVANEPRLSGFAPASNPAIEKAIDDQKQSVAAVVRPLPMFEKPAPAQANNGIGNFGIGNGVGNGILLNNAASATTGFAAFQFTVLVKPGENAVKKLQELTGKLKIQTIVDTEPLAVIDKIMEATGKTAQSKDGTTSVKIANIRKLANGDIAVQVSIGDTNGQNAGAAGAIQIQGGGNIQINGRNVIVAGVGGPASPASNIRLLDAKGQSFQHTQTTGSGISINNNQITYTQVLIFHPHEGQGEPAQLALFGQRAFAFDVPFTLKEIRLP